MIKESEIILKKLFPICRSITGNGVRQMLSILKKEVTDFDIKEIPSGTVCYDWVVPDEWNISDAYIADSSGKKIIDYKKNNLHIVNYSVPVNQTMKFDELKKHLYFLPDMPNAIPYRTSYYKRTWGFCLSYNQLKEMDKKAKYHVFIDSALRPASLTYGEKIIKGTSGKEFLFSTYCCHPSLANDNLSGQVLWSFLLRQLKAKKLRHSYRFVILPETIGAIAYLSKNETKMKKISGGYVITSVAGPGKYGYKYTYLGNHLIDKAVENTFKDLKIKYIPYPFDILGSDERHYSSPFFRIPIGTICKDKYYEYDCYHTSLDNLDFISAKNLIKTLDIYSKVIDRLEMDLTFKSLCPYCEPNLGKRGLYPEIGGSIKQKAADFKKKHHDRKYQISQKENIKGNKLDIIRWLLFYSDGKTSLFDIYHKTGFQIEQLYEVAEELRRHNLLALV